MVMVGWGVEVCGCAIVIFFFLFTSKQGEI